MPRGKKTTPKGESKVSPAINKEIKNLGLLGGAILLLVTMFIPGALGVIGPFFRNILLGLFGFGGIALPIALAAIAVLGLISKEFKLPIVRTLILAWLVLALLHIIINRTTLDYTSAWANLRAIYVQGSPSGGGFFGALLGNLISFVIGDIGAVIVFVVAIVMLAVFISGRSFVTLVGNGVTKAREAYEERAERRQVEASANIEMPRQAHKPTKDKNSGVLKPLPRRPHEQQEDNGLFEIDAAEHKDADFTVLLVGEEIIEPQKQAQRRESPTFIASARQQPEHEPKVVQIDTEYDYELEYDPEPEVDSALVVRGLVGDSVPEASPVYEAADAPNTAASMLPQSPEHTYKDFELPSLDLLARNEKPAHNAESRAQVMKNSRILEETLRSFRIEAKVVQVSVGPTVTRYDLAPGPGVKVSSIANLSNDLALSLAAQGIRIEAPIPGKAAVGIEIPNKEPQGVYLREILESDRFDHFQSKLAFAVGKDIAGDPVVADVVDMPHLLIAGATGAGKSVCINTLIASLLYKARPDEVKLLMIDPKVVELSVYNGIPHLLIPVVTDPKKASGALNWAVQEMESRYNSFAETGCRDLKSYNRHLEENDSQVLPQIVIIIDELADLMMTCKGEVEEAICRLAQKARAAGLHLIVATQRPSVDVITGLIKANIPSRLAFAVSSGTDSRTVLDMQGAEKLLGRGDMLFLPRGQNKPVRIQGGFISDKEVEKLVDFLKAQAPAATVSTEMIQQITMPGKTNVEGELDEFFHDSVELLLVKGKASTSMLQRQFRIGYNRASRLMDDLERRGIVGPEDGVKPRKVTITREEYNEIYGNQNN